uniref:B30.2/SPRY domain-containing protein n=1 Tax=Maylandia zebra TaxID=106582 RepID=A0A3P9DU52_9CICH
MTENLHIPLSYYFASLFLVSLNLIVVILLASSLVSLVVLSLYTSVFSSNLTYGHMSVVYSIKYNLPTSPHLFIQHFRMMSYSDHPDRFTVYYQVLSRESLTGRCYWEVEWRGGGVGVAVAYKNISRAGGGDECVFGFNNKSWALYWYTDNNKFRHNNVQTHLSGPRSSRVGVYLDHRAGILSFYSVSETMTLLHRVQTTFTQPLYAGLGLWKNGATAELIKVKQRRQVHVDP